MTVLSEVRPRSFAFVFPMASGHINPSLPIARSLTKLGHRVHYLCREQMRGAIEGTGAEFHSDVENEPELYTGREAGLFGAFEAVRSEYGMEANPLASVVLKELMQELMLPGLLRWLRKVEASAVVFCPIMNGEAALAAEVLGLPSVALLTTAGPGSMAKLLRENLATQGKSPGDAVEARRAFQPLLDCLERLKVAYGLDVSVAGATQPLGRLDGVARSHLTLVTTCSSLEDPVSPELAQAYREAGAAFEYVGPLLDVQGARRAAGHKFAPGAAHAPAHATPEGPDPLEMLRVARAVGRKVVLVSMGTVITGDSPDYGWDAQLVGSDGRRRGLSGKELCQAAWAGAFEAFPAASPDFAADTAPLLLVALGPQDAALGALPRPVNAICLPELPQVDILKAGVDLFLTHGGQNSFMEALSLGVPVVVCPGFADQPVNAQKAEDMGVGLQVKRPMPAEGQEAAAASAYQQEVAATLERVLADPSFGQAASNCSEQLREAGGVPRAVDLVLSAGAARAPARAGA